MPRQPAPVFPHRPFIGSECPLRRDAWSACTRERSGRGTLGFGQGGRLFHDHAISFPRRQRTARGKPHHTQRHDAPRLHAETRQVQRMCPRIHHRKYPIGECRPASARYVPARGLPRQNKCCIGLAADGLSGLPFAFVRLVLRPRSCLFFDLGLASSVTLPTFSFDCPLRPLTYPAVAEGGPDPCSGEWGTGDGGQGSGPGDHTLAMRARGECPADRRI